MNRNPLNFTAEQLVSLQNQAASMADVPLLDDAAMDDYMRHERSIIRNVMWGGNDKKQTTKMETI